MEPARKRRKVSYESEERRDEVADGTDQQGIRHSLFVRSLPASVTTERLIEHFSQSYPLKHATVVLDPKTKISRGFGFVTFTDPEDAKQALAEFNDSVLDGRKIKVEVAEARHRDVEEYVEGGKRRAKNATAEELRAKRRQDQEDNQPPRLIVRNLPWSIKTADDLTKLFLSYGKVKHAVLPTLSGKKDAQAGFGIVLIRGKKNAERALHGVNGKIVEGRTLAVDWAVDKETWQKLQRGLKDPSEAGVEERQSSGRPSAEDEDRETASDEEEDMGVAIDVVEEEDDGDDDGIAPGDETEDFDEEDAQLNGVDLDASDTSSLAADSDAPTTANASKFNAENTTVFIRNLPYDTDDESLADHFRTHFGHVRYSRVVYDPETERSRGTAFICFRNEEDAKSCVKNCPKLEAAADSRNHKNGAPSILQDTKADPTGKYTLNDRLLHVTRALPKNEADRRTAEGQTKRLTRQQSDKRRLYLLSEGTVSPGSSLYNALSKTELDIRESSLKQRQKLVKSNPNLGLSLTRLSLRNLPRWMDSKALKALAREAIVGFASDVKSGLRQPISKEELARDGEVGRQAELDRKKAGKGVVKQAKIVYESDTTGTKVGEGKGGRSRGYGFVEYWGHRSALMGLRWLNGYLVKKPKNMKDKGDGDDDGDRGKRLVVEFAIENAQVVQRRSERERRLKQRMTGEPKADGETKSGKKRKMVVEDNAETGNGQKQTKQTSSVKDDGRSQDEKNKIAARNRIIAQKRQKRRMRKGKA